MSSAQRATVLLVEDSETLRQYALQSLQAGGYRVVTAADGREALARYREDRPDLIVLDVDLPIMDGWEILARIRESDSDTPVLMLTASAPDERSKVRGLVSGADDYVIKPVGPAELRARVGALLRRASRGGGNDQPKRDVYQDPLVTVDFGRRRVEVAGRELSLTPLEFKLMATFVRNAGETLDRTTLLEQVWDDYSGVGGDQVKVYVGYLRRKLGELTQADLVQTVRGFGYRYVAPQPGS